MPNQDWVECYISFSTNELSNYIQNGDLQTLGTY